MISKITQLAWLCWLSAEQSSGALLASGQIEQCINEGTETELDCDTKMVVTLTLTDNQGEVESLRTTMSEVSDVDGQTRELQNPWTISLSKSDVINRYPLTYIQSFHANPVEVVVQTKAGYFGIGGCSDDPSDNPTCGWARTSSGKKIADSQGFCCKCDTLSTDTVRGIGECDLVSSIETAHCLSFEQSDLWYSAYQIGTVETVFLIDVIIRRTDPDTGLEVGEKLTVSPSNPGSRSSDGQIIIKLIGDLATYKAVEDFDGFFYLVPGSPPDHERVQNRLDNALLVPDSLVTLDGLDCNKIGVSYSAFRYQADGCRQPVGSCLANQIEALHERGEHFAKDRGNPSSLFTEEGVFLSFSSEMTRTSLVSLTINADKVQFVVNRADGKFKNCSIADFESMSDGGKLSCTVVSEGSVEAQFRISVTNCTGGIKPILGETFTLEPYGTHTRYFDVLSENEQTSEHSCMCTLYDSLEQELDHFKVEFVSFEVVIDKGAQEGNGPPNLGDSTTGDQARYSCASQCQSILDIPCLVMHQCWDTIGTLILVVLAILVLGPCVVKLVMSRMRAAGDAANEGLNRSSKKRRKRDEHDTMQVVMTPNGPVYLSDRELCEMEERGDRKSRRRRKRRKHRSGDRKERSSKKKSKHRSHRKKKKKRHRKRRETYAESSEDSSSKGRRRYGDRDSLLG